MKREEYQDEKKSNSKILDYKLFNYHTAFSISDLCEGDR